MFLSKRTPIIIGIVAVVLATGIAVAVIYDHRLRTPEPDKAVPPTKFKVFCPAHVRAKTNL